MATINGTNGDDSLNGTSGADTIDGLQGDDTLLGQGGDDVFVLSDGFGNDSVTGGEAGETEGDKLDMSGLTSDTTVDLRASDPETFTVSDGTATAQFSEIENILLGDGRDTLVLADGSGGDTVSGFDMTDAGDGTTRDRLDVSGLTKDGSTPVDVTNVTVSDDGWGNAVLNFPGGEQITLIGVAPSQLDSVGELNAIGIPLALDYVVEGTGGGDLIDGSYAGDPDGDVIDGGDAIDGSDDDHVEAGAGDDTILAGAGDDSVIADAGDDSVDGGSGADTIRGGTGADTIEGGDGDDVIYGNEDGDSITGGDGADSIYGEYGDDYVEGGAGDDHLEGNEGADTIHGGAGNDWIRGSYDDDEIWGGTGDDYLWGGFNDDTFIIENDFGNDTIDAEGVNEVAGDTLDLSRVTDDLTIDLTHVNPEIGTFTDGVSTAEFDEIENIILGGGRDTLVLADFSGAEFVHGFNMADSGDGTTVDQLDVSALTSDWGTTPVNVDDVTVSDDGAGNARLSFPAGESITLYGVTPAQLATPQALVSIGIPAGRDYVVEGTGGADLIDGAYAGDPEGDRIDAADNALGTDADEVRAGAGDDTVLAGLGNDTVFGGTGDDSIEGGFGNDSILAEEGDDIVHGGDGNDTIMGFEGNDWVSGDAGDDLINTRTSPGTGAPDVGYPGYFAGDTDPNNDRDTVFGGDGNDTILTGDDADSVDGGSGADSIDAGFDDDTVLGGDGNDTILANEGNDLVDGGLGDDLIHGDGTDTLTGPLNIDDASDLAPDNGHDTIHGGDGNDTIYGMDDGDLLYGDAGHDVIDGGLDEDTILGGAGNDQMSGGAGDDLFIIADGDGDDTVTGGETGESDGDTMDFGTMPGDIDVTYSGDESGLVSHASGSVAFGEIEAIHLGAGDDSVDANLDSAGTEIWAGDGNDTFIGGTGGDTVFGFDGDDSIYGQDGADSLDGDEGHDTLDGGAGDDTLIGDGGDDWLYGDTGADEIYAGDGNDSIMAAEGDSAYGGDGDDTFYIADYGEAGSAGITIVGGETGETNGDTLNFQGLTQWADIVYSNADPGTGGGLSGTATLADGSVVSFSEIENIVICFTAGTRIATAAGLREVQDLAPGDLVVTRDHGLQPVRWAGRRTVPAQGSLAPVRIAAGVLGNARALLVSPQHRMLVQGMAPNLLFGETEVLATAKHLINGGSVVRQPGGEVCYVHILFDRHEIVYAEGAPSESFFPGDAGLSAVEAAAREELFTLFPELRSSAGEFRETARMCLRAHESRLLRLG